jgi:hypothetical protein
MDSSLGLNIFSVLFLVGTFLAALVAGVGGFAFGSSPPRSGSTFSHRCRPQP